MADDNRDPSDPPRKVYDLKPKEFDRVNPVRPESQPLAQNSTPAAREIDPAKPIDVRELHRQATTPGPVLSPGTRRNDPNAVHAILRDNLARENAAGLNEVPLRPKRKSRRKRDYFLVLMVSDGFLGAFAVNCLHNRNAIGFVYAIAGIGLITASLTWVMWFVMDDY
jgi:hypothetical protein